MSSLNSTMRIYNTSLSGSNLQNAQQSSGLSTLSEFSGSCVLSSTGTYGFKDNNNNPLVIPPGALVVYSSLTADVPLVSSGAPSFSLGLSQSYTGSTAIVSGTSLISNVSQTGVNSGCCAAPSASPAAPYVASLSAYYPVVNVQTATATGTVRATLVTL